MWRTDQGGKQLDTLEAKANSQDSSFSEDWIGATVQARNIGREDLVEGLVAVTDAFCQPTLFRDLMLTDPQRFIVKRASVKGHFARKEAPFSMAC